jgi:hypothetical protein
MPDRYGQDAEDYHDGDPVTARDLELHAIAETVPCRYCGAQPGQPCRNQTLPTKPPTRIPHTARTNDAVEVPF